MRPVEISNSHVFRLKYKLLRWCGRGEQIEIPFLLPTTYAHFFRRSNVILSTTCGGITQLPSAVYSYTLFIAFVCWYYMRIVLTKLTGVSSHVITAVCNTDLITDQQKNVMLFSQV